VSVNHGALPGYLAMFSQLCHLVILGDFLYYYYLALKKGDKTMALPTSAAIADNV
jgi:hypothetical protein